MILEVLSHLLFALQRTNSLPNIFAHLEITDQLGLSLRNGAL